MPAVLRSAPEAASWLHALHGMTDAQLSQLLRLRPDVVLSRPAHLADVASRMVTPASAAVFHETADLPSRQVLEALSVLGPTVNASRLERSLGCAPGALETLIGCLEAAGMVLVDGETIVANPGLAAIEWPCRLGPPAARLLGQRSNIELASLARRLGLAPSGAKVALLQRITRALSDKDFLDDLLRQAPPRTAELIEMAVHQWPNLQIPAGVGLMSRQWDRPPGWCLQHGLLLGTGYNTAVMPREVALALRDGRLVASFRPAPPALRTRPADQGRTDRSAAETALALVADVAAICESWGAAPAKTLQAGGLGIREVRRVAGLVGRSAEAAARLVELAGAAGLVGCDAAAAMPTCAYDRWKQLAAPARWAFLASEWLAMPAMLSVAGATDEDGKPVPPLLDDCFSPETVMQRSLVIRILADVEAGQASDPEAVAELAVWAMPAVWEDGIDPRLAVRYVLEEAAMLGLVAEGAVSGFGRLLADGDAKGAAEALGALAPPVVEKVILQADMTATAAGDPAPALRAELDLLADVESSGHATVWRFGEASLRRAFDAGRSAAEVLAFLDGHAAMEVPQPLAYLVEDVGRRHGQVRVGPAGCYLRCDDPSLLAEIQRSKKAAHLGLRTIAPTVSVSTRPPGEVTAVLRAAGYLPALEGADGRLALSRPATRRLAEPDDGDLDDGDLDDGRDGGDLPSTVEDIDEVVARLRRAPDPPRRRDDKAARVGPRRDPSPFVSIFETGGRPNHIAKDCAEIASLLEEAHTKDWPVRMGYVNAAGLESEFCADVLLVRRHDLRVRYIDRHGGGELAMHRVQWARVLTEAEEEQVR